MNENEENQLSRISDDALIKELYRRDRMTNAAFHSKIMRDGLDENTKIIVTRGISIVNRECSRCRKTFPPEQFGWYKGRVSKDGHLMRSNAVCRACIKKSKDELKNALKNTGIGAKPKEGEACSHCEREWSGNWHRHHQGDEVIGWICGHCNMSFSDHRNEDVMKKRKLR